MKTKKWMFILIAGMLGIAVFSVSVSAQSSYYKMNNIKMQYYINASRNAVKNNNLQEACVLARKAIQSNSWNKEAWSNYDDIVKRLVKSGQVKNFTLPKTLNNISASTPSPAQSTAPSPAQAAPTPSSSAGQYEGC
jgi:predicted ferric reductase